MLLALAIGDPAGASAFLAEIGGAASEVTPYRGVDVSTYRDGLASAESDGFLLLGRAAAVRAGIDASAAEVEPLSEDDEAQRARDELPADRLADVYVSRDGIEALLADRGGVADQLDTFTDFDASEGITAALTAGEAGLEVELTSQLDPDAAEAAPSFFSAFPAFEPSQASRFASDTLALLAVGEPSQTVGLLLDQAEAAFPGIADAVERLDADLSTAGGSGIERDLLPLLEGEATIGVTPAQPVPYVTAVFDDVDEQQAREVVAGLQAPLIAAFDPLVTGQAPTLPPARCKGSRCAASVSAPDSSRPTPCSRTGSSSPPIRPVSSRRSRARTTLPRARTTATRPEPVGGEVSALVFLNLAGLVRLAEPRGLAEIVSAFQEDLARLRALGLSVESSGDSLQTSVFLHIE